MTVTIDAAHSKRRRREMQVVPPDVVQYWSDWIDWKKPREAEQLFPVSTASGGKDRRTSEMMAHDLGVARQIRLDEVADGQERAEREKSDCLAYRDAEGKFADYHATRHTCITNLGRAGVAPKTAQTLAR